MKSAGTDSPVEFQERVIKLIRSLLPVDGERFYIYLPHRQIDHTITSDSGVLEMKSKYEEFAWEYDPLHPSYFEGTDTTVITNSMLMSDDEWQNSKIFSELFEPVGYFHNADIFFRQSNKIIAVLSLLRRGRANAFTDQEVVALKNVQPFIEYTLSKVYLPKRIRDRDTLGNKFNLTTRELDVVEYALTGISNKELVRHLNISLPTLRTHLQKIYLKTEVHSSSELIAKLLRETKLSR